MKRTSKIISCIILTVIIGSSVFLNQVAASPYNIKQGSKIVIKKGEKVKLKTKWKKNLKWKIKDNSIATINKNGTVKGLKEGKTIIKVVRNNKNIKCIIIVKKKVVEAIDGKIELSSIYNDKIVTTTIKNKSDCILKIGSPTLEKYQNGKWIVVGQKEPVVDTLPYEYLEARNNVKLKKNISLYNIESGKFRVVYKCKNLRNNKNITTYSEFNINDI